MENISVYIRIKPTNNSESTFSKDKDTKSLTNLKTKETFTFDSILPSTSTNDSIFCNHLKDSLSCLLRGLNVSIFAYGQTSTGKTYTMRGTNISVGLIPLSIKEIFTKLNDQSISKPLIKVSYVEIYNESVNDLIDSHKKNLEIRESVAKGVFVNNVTEIIVTTPEKIIQLLNQGETNRSIAETKLNEKSSRSHTIFKITVEFNRKETRFVSQLNLVDLAGSENVSKAKCEGIRLKEGANINKSLLALSSVINKLSQSSSKNFVNYRDSKLTRLLQTALGGNSKTIIICTIADDVSHYNETLNTLHFGLKAKNVKTTVKVNELLDEKGRIVNENNQLKNKIKMLEEMIMEKKENVESSDNLTKSIMNTAPKQERLETDTCSNDALASLEKEIIYLKRLLMNKEELGDDQMNNSVNNDMYSTHSSGLYHNLMQNEYKNNYMRSAMKCSDNANGILSYSLGPYHFEPTESQSMLLSQQSSRYKRLCMTEHRGFNPPMNNNSLQNTSSKLMMMNSNYKPNEPSDFMIGMSGSDFYQKENEELRRNIYEMRKTYYDVIQNKENQIKLLNENHTITIENCEKLIKEAEDNYLNLKLNFDQAKDDIKRKDEEISILNQKVINQESSLNYFQTQSHSQQDIEALLSENNTLKSNNDSLKRIKDQLDSSNREITKLKAAAVKSKALPLTSAINPNATINDKKVKKIMTNYEEKIQRLEGTVEEYKTNVNTINEYQKLLDESFDKINELNKELNTSKDKVKYLEKALRIVESNTKTKVKESFFTGNDEEDLLIDEFNLVGHGNDFLGKKRKFLPKIYQNILEKNITSSNGTVLKTPKEREKDKGIQGSAMIGMNEISDFQV